MQDKADILKELQEQSPLLESLKKKIDNDLPTDFFQENKSNILEIIAREEELKETPLLAAIKNDLHTDLPTAKGFNLMQANILKAVNQESNKKSNVISLAEESKNKKRIWSIAASIFLLVAAGVFFLTATDSILKGNNETSTVTENEIFEYISANIDDYDTYSLIEGFGENSIADVFNESRLLDEFTTEGLETLEYEDVIDLDDLLIEDLL